MDVLYESVDKNQTTKERTKTEDERERAFRTRVLTENELHMHRAHAKQGTVSEQELSQVWPGGVTERRDGKYCRRKRGPFSAMLSGKMTIWGLKCRVRAFFHPQKHSQDLQRS